MLSNQPWLMHVTPTALLGSWVLQPIEEWHPLDWLWDACQMARVRWGAHCKGFNCKEGLHYWIEQSARNPMEHNQVPRALGELSRSCCQASNNQPWFTSLEIPWGFLAQAVLRWLSGGLCPTRKCQFKDIMWEEKVGFAIAQRTFAGETFGKRRNGERKPVLNLVPDSGKHLAWRKHVMCARNMGAHVRRGTLEYQRHEKMGQEIGFPCSQVRREETSK